MAELLLAIGFLLAIAFTVVNGFHDASNANALPVRFNALTPRVAVGMGAVFNVLGALTVGLVLTQLIPFDVHVPISTVGTVVIICTLVTVVAWDLLTWWWAMPASSTAAMSGGVIGSLAGAHAVGLAPDLAVHGDAVWHLVLPIVVAPAIAFILAQVLVFVAVYLVRHQAPGVVKRRSAVVQATGAAAIHFGHGIQHGRLAIWVFVVLLMCYGLVIPMSDIPWWIPVLVGLCLGAGTLLGGWRIAYTLSSRVVNLDPLRGAVAQTVAGSLLFIGGFLALSPMSTSQTSTAAILGAGTLQRFRTVYHRTLVQVLTTWAVTAPVCAVVAGTLFLAASPLLQLGA